jgi:chemotaxis protein histidine kinase CheA
MSKIIFVLKLLSACLLISSCTSEPSNNSKKESSPEKISDKLNNNNNKKNNPEKISDKLSNNNKENNPEKISDKLSNNNNKENNPEKISDKLSSNNKQNSPEKISDKLSNNNKENNPEKISDKLNNNNKENNPEKISDKLNNNNNKKNSPEKISDKLSNNNKENNPEKISDKLNNNNNKKNSPEKISDKLNNNNNKKNSPEKISDKLSNNNKQNSPEEYSNKIDIIPIKNSYTQESAWECSFATMYNTARLMSLKNKIYLCKDKACIESLFIDSENFKSATGNQNFKDFQHELAKDFYPIDFYGALVGGEINKNNGLVEERPHAFLIPKMFIGQYYGNIMVSIEALANYFIKNKIYTAQAVFGASKNDHTFNALEKSNKFNEKLNKLIIEFTNKKIDTLNILTLMGIGGGHYFMLSLMRYDQGKKTALLVLDSIKDKDDDGQELGYSKFAQTAIPRLLEKIEK